MWLVLLATAAAKPAITTQRATACVHGNSSINAYHRERKFKVNKACIAALFKTA